MAEGPVIITSIDGADREIVSGQIIIKFKNVKSIKSEHKFIYGPDHRGIAVVQIEDVDIAAQLKSLAADSNVEWADADDVDYPDNIPDDPLFSQQWGMQKVNAEGAWAQILGHSDVLIAVLDSGIPLDNNGNIAHEDISRFAELGPDQNGVDPLPIDRGGHGTHVAGIATAVDNRLGIMGMAPYCRLYVTKVFNDAGVGSVSKWYRGVVSAVARAQQENKRLVVNYSGSGPSERPLHHEGIAEIATVDGVLCASCGNTGGSVRYPAALSAIYDRVIAVGNSTENDQLSPSSSRGPETTVVAPGVAILSTVLVDQGKYDVKSGTSMSSPLVAGVAGLMFTVNPTISAADLVAAIKATAKDLGVPGDDPVFGSGRLDAREAVRVVNKAPMNPGDPIPKPLPWPNAPWPPPNINLILTNVYGAGVQVGIAIMHEVFNRIEPARSALIAAKENAIRSGVWDDFTALDAAIASPTPATIRVVRNSLEAEAQNRFCFKAGWLSLRGLYDMGFHLHNGMGMGELPNGPTTRDAIRFEMNKCREEMINAVICGPALKTVEAEINKGVGTTPPSAHVVGLKKAHRQVSQTLLLQTAVRVTQVG